MYGCDFGPVGPFLRVDHPRRDRLCFCFLFSLPQPLHVGQLEKGDPVYQGHCQWGTSSEKEP